MEVLAHAKKIEANDKRKHREARELIARKTGASDQWMSSHIKFIVG